MSISPSVQTILNSLLLIKRIVLVAQVNFFRSKLQTLKNGFAFATTLSADICPEKDIASPASCNRDRRLDDFEL